jgi:hypothetical protein
VHKVVTRSSVDESITSERQLERRSTWTNRTPPVTPCRREVDAGSRRRERTVSINGNNAAAPSSGISRRSLGGELGRNAARLSSTRRKSSECRDEQHRWFAFAAACPVACLPWRIRPGRSVSTRPTETFTPGLPAGRSPFPPPGMTTVATGQVPPAGLSPAGTATSVAAQGRDAQLGHGPRLLDRLDDDRVADAHFKPRRRIPILVH